MQSCRSLHTAGKSFKTSVILVCIPRSSPLYLLVEESFRGVVWKLHNTERSQMREPLDHCEDQLEMTYFCILSKIAKMSTSDKKLKMVFMLPDKSKKEPEEICEVVIFNSWYLINHYIKCKNYR